MATEHHARHPIWVIVKRHDLHHHPAHPRTSMPACLKAWISEPWLTAWSLSLMIRTRTPRLCPSMTCHGAAAPDVTIARHGHERRGLAMLRRW